MGVPKYLNIKKQLLKEIVKQPADTPIESERDLAEKYDASRMTVRNAVNELVHEGYLYRNKNKGTFVADKQYNHKEGPFGDLFGNDELEYTIIYYNVKSIPEMAPRLHLNSDDSILRIVRISKKEEIPVSVDEIYFDYGCINKEDIRNIYRLMNLDAYAQNGKVVQKLFPSLIPDQYANLLNMEQDTPVLLIESMIYTVNSKPSICVRSYRTTDEPITVIV